MEFGASTVGPSATTACQRGTQNQPIQYRPPRHFPSVSRRQRPCPLLASPQWSSRPGTGCRVPAVGRVAGHHGCWAKFPATRQVGEAFSLVLPGIAPDSPQGSFPHIANLGLFEPLVLRVVSVSLCQPSGSKKTVSSFLVAGIIVPKRTNLDRCSPSCLPMSMCNTNPANGVSVRGGSGSSAHRLHVEASSFTSVRRRAVDC